MPSILFLVRFLLLGLLGLACLFRFLGGGDSGALGAVGFYTLYCRNSIGGIVSILRLGLKLAGSDTKLGITGSTFNLYGHHEGVGLFLNHAQVGNSVQQGVNGGVTDYVLHFVSVHHCVFLSGL